MGALKNPLRALGVRSLDSRFVRGLQYQDPWRSLGKQLYVQSVKTGATDGGGNPGEDPNYPLASIARALVIGRLAGVAPTIHVGAGHVETVSAADALDVAGLHIIGHGERGQKPVITFGTVTTSKYTVSAAGVLMHNIKLAAGIDSLANMLVVTGADFMMTECRIEDTAAAQTLTALLITGARCRITRLMAKQLTAGAAQCISINGADDFQLYDSFIRGDYSAANLVNVTTACLDVDIERNRMENLNAVCDNINIASVASTGFIVENDFASPTDADVAWVVQGANSLIRLGGNRGTNVKQETGMLVGTASS